MMILKHDDFGATRWDQNALRLHGITVQNDTCFFKIINGEFCVRNDGFCIQNDGCCIINGDFCVRNDVICIQNDGCCIINGEFCVRNDGICIQNDGCCIKGPQDRDSARHRLCVIGGRCDY